MSDKYDTENIGDRINFLEVEIKKVKAERDRLENILSSLDTGLSLINPDSTISWVNNRIREMFPDGEPIGKICHRFYESSDNKCVPCPTFQSFQNGCVGEIERFNPANKRWYRIISQPIKSPDGQVINVLEGITEITESKQAEIGLAENERNMSTILNNTHDLVVRIDRDFKNIFANSALYSTTGLTPEKYLGKTNEEIGMNEQLCSFWRKKHQKVFATGEPDYFEFRYPTVDKGERTFQAAVCPEFNDNEEVETIISFMRDINDLKQAEQALKQSEHKFHLLFDNAPVGYQSLDENGCFLDVNQAWLDILGYKRDEVIGKWFGDFLPSELVDIFRERFKQNIQSQGLIENVEFPLVRKDGSIVVADYLARIGRDEEGRFLRTHCAFSDITEKKRLQAQLLQSQKAETIATLAGGIAHDYNNLLAVIMGNLSMAQEETEPHSAMAELLHEIEQASYKAKDLTHQFLTLSHGGHPRKESGSIESLLKEIPKQVQANESIKYTISIKDNLWPVEHDSKQIQDAVSNVLKNAVEAMPQGGTITVQAENRIIDNKKKDPALPLNEGRYVRISIKDEGTGISEEHMDKVFDPYFSTKARGAQKGMGLGLTTAYAVVQKHGGHIMVNSTTGLGTTVTIFLPAGEKIEKKKSAKQVSDNIAPSISSGQPTIKRILVMDDEEMLRNLAQKMLERLEYKVETVKDGMEAIEKYKKYMDSGEPFHGVILDLTIKGGMGGAQAIKELIKIDPGVKAIVCSGYFNDPVLANYEEHGFQGAMAKPYQKADLESVLKKVLG